MLAAFALQAAIGLGPAALTYPEVADALTRAGMPTLASGGLRSRAAYVNLRGRSPEAVRRLLGEALGVAFEPQKDGGWLMVADPEVKARDRRFLLAYRRLAAARFRAIREEAARIARNLAYPDLLAEVERRVEGGGLRGTSPEARRTRQATVLLGPQTWSGVGALASPDALAAIEGEIVRRVPFESLGVPAEAYARLEFRDGASVRRPVRLPLGTLAERRIAFDPRDGTLNVSTILPSLRGTDPYAATGSAPVSSGSSWPRTFGPIGSEALTFGIERGTVADTFRGMGEEAARYEAGLAPAAVPAIPLPRPAISLSEGLEASGVEAAMELSPRFDPLWRDPRPGATLRDLFVPERLRPAPLWERIHDVEPGVERGWPWRPVVREGVLLAIDPYAFLDRAQPDAAAPYVRVARETATIRDDMAGAPTWRLAHRIVAAAGPETTLDRMDAVYRNPRHVDYRTLARTVAALDATFGTSLSSSWGRLRRGETVVLALSDGRIELRARPLFGTVYLFHDERFDRAGRSVDGGEALIDGRGTLVP